MSDKRIGAINPVRMPSPACVCDRDRVCLLWIDSSPPAELLVDIEALTLLGGDGTGAWNVSSRLPV